MGLSDEPLSLLLDEDRQVRVAAAFRLFFDLDIQARGVVLMLDGLLEQSRGKPIERDLLAIKEAAEAIFALTGPYVGAASAELLRHPAVGFEAQSTVLH